MRLIPRHRYNRQAKAPRVAITQAEITADLLYPAHPRTARRRTVAGAREGHR